MRKSYYKFHKFFKFFPQFDPAHFAIEHLSESAVRLVYKSGPDFKLPLQETTYTRPEGSSTLILQSMTFLCNWYLAVTLDKFGSDAPPDYSAFHPRIAPYHVGVVPAEPGNIDMDNISNKICTSLNKHGVVSRIFEKDDYSGMLGTPFDVLVDEQCVREEKVTLLDRKNRTCHVVSDIGKLPEIFRLYWNSVID